MRKKFAYLRPASVAEALELKAKYGAAAQFLAGGTDLIGEWKREVTAFDYVIDITRLSELSYIKEDGGDLRVGALTTLAEIADATPVDALVICMSSAAQRMATPQIRTIATIGGNICHASPCADMAVILTMFDAVAVVRSTEGERTIPMSEFFTGNKSTTMRDDELLVEVRMPLPERPTRAVFESATRASVDLAQASAGVCLTAQDGKVTAGAHRRGRLCARPRALRRGRGDAGRHGRGRAPTRASSSSRRRAWRRRRARSATSALATSTGASVTRVLVRRAVDDCLSQAGRRAAAGDKVERSAPMATLHVNGKLHELDIEPHETLAEVLREKLGLHRGEGLVRRGRVRLVHRAPRRPARDLVPHAGPAGRGPARSRRSRGSAPRTTCTRSSRRSSTSTGFQCGVCTPGIILSTKALLEKNPQPTTDEVATALNGHICRCGAYPQIVRLRDVRGGANGRAV